MQYLGNAIQGVPFSVHVQREITSNKDISCDEFCENLMVAPAVEDITSTKATDTYYASDENEDVSL